MAVGILGEKVGMTRIFTKQGDSIPVTVIIAGPCRAIQQKNIEKDGYNAIQLGFKSIKTISSGTGVWQELTQP